MAIGVLILIILGIYLYKTYRQVNTTSDVKPISWTTELENVKKRDLIDYAPKVGDEVNLWEDYNSIDVVAFLKGYVSGGGRIGIIPYHFVDKTLLRAINKKQGRYLCIVHKVDAEEKYIEVKIELWTKGMLEMQKRREALRKQ